MAILEQLRVVTERLRLALDSLEKHDNAMRQTLAARGVIVHTKFFS